ncbi:ABC transporter permease [Consotaella aegiceratis]|uniref:ABC transporter permease n=1 Tax=Consotaella aegiceratis TaxID=3097961 RepID=UPI002F420D71
MTAYVGRRLAQACVVMVVVIVFNFVLLHMVPGDLVDVLAGQANMDADQMQVLRERYGLDQPVIVQFGTYLFNLAHFDLCYSPVLAAPVSTIILERLPVTGLLVGLSVLLSLFVGSLVGVTAARLRGTVFDTAISVLVLLFYATPMFLAGLLLILIFSVKLHLLPIAGFATPGAGSGVWSLTLDVARHLIMPVASLSLFYVALYARLGRASMIEALGQDYVRTARAKGLTRRRTVYVHALRNALLPLVTMAGLQVSAMLGGAVLIESVFSLPGLGRTALDAVLQRDVNLLLGVLLVASAVVVAINLIVDLLYVVLDPRIELA